MACANFPRGVEFRGSSAPFFLHILKQKKIDQDREASLIKKEYCRLSPSPHSLQVTPSRARPPLVKRGQANWCPSLGLRGSAESLGKQASIALRGRAFALEAKQAKQEFSPKGRG